MDYHNVIVECEATNRNTPSLDDVYTPVNMTRHPTIFWVRFCFRSVLFDQDGIVPPASVNEKYKTTSYRPFYFKKCHFVVLPLDQIDGWSSITTNESQNLASANTITRIFIESHHVRFCQNFDYIKRSSPRFHVPTHHFTKMRPLNSQLY